MPNIIFALASFLVAVFAFGYGAAKLFKKKKPMYLQLLVCAAGCFAIQQLSYVVDIWNSVTAPVSIGMLGTFGCNFFLLSANFGTLDSIVDDDIGSGKARVFSIIAPIIMAMLDAVVFLRWKSLDMFCAVMLVIVFIPVLPASYFNLKHILLPTDPFGLLRATKSCNIAALAFYIITAVYLIFSVDMNGTVNGILTFAVSVSVLCLSLSAVRGAKKWGI